MNNRSSYLNLQQVPRCALSVFTPENGLTLSVSGLYQTLYIQEFLELFSIKTLAYGFFLVSRN